MAKNRGIKRVLIEQLEQRVLCSATYLGADGATEGTWKSSYGADGYNVAANQTSYPTYAAVTTSGASSWTWNGSTTDTRALQKAATGSTDRIAAALYGSSFTVDVNVTDGQSHKVSLYLLDWDSTGRDERIDVLDTSGNVLSTQTVSSFHSGEYLSWSISGHVTFRITALAGSNAVASGLFFGSAPAAPGASATFLAADTTTQGTWQGAYGGEGYNIINSQASTPSYATVTPAGNASWTWNAATTDSRALQIPGSNNRVAAAWYSSSSFTIDVNLTDGLTHQVSLYALDWDNTNRSEKIDILSTSGNLLNSQTVSSFHSGEYLSWTLGGHVQIRITDLTGTNAVVSGLFFGPHTAAVGLPAASTNLAATATSASTVNLSWTNNATNASGYRIYRSTDGNTFTQIASLAATSTSYSDSGLSASTKYWYKADPWNSTGETAASAVAATTQSGSTFPLTVTTRSMTSFTELSIVGTSGNDVITVSQSGSTFTITDGSQSQQITGTFGDLVVKGNGGSDSITINSSVNIATLLYGGTGNNTLVDQGTNFNTLATIGDGASNLTGNGINTNYWGNSGDTINASSAEINAGDVHRVTSMVSPAQPTDTSGAYTLPNSSLWGTGPTVADVNQRPLADCYYLATINALAYSNAAKLRTLAVQLGDGTYLVQYDRGGSLTYVHVDGTFSSQAAVVGTSGNVWAMVMEKAYAYFRTGANTYASLNYGNSGVVMDDFGISSSSVYANSPASTLYSTISSELAAKKPVTASTGSSTSTLIASHTYSVLGVSTVNGVMWVTLQNPWGSAAANDGLVTITMAVLQSDVNWINYQI